MQTPHNAPAEETCCTKNRDNARVHGVPDATRLLWLAGAAHPPLVYAHITGYGATGPAADDASYDHGAYWAYSGLAAMFGDEHGTPPQAASTLESGKTTLRIASGFE